MAAAAETEEEVEMGWSEWKKRGEYVNSKAGNI